MNRPPAPKDARHCTPLSTHLAWLAVVAVVAFTARSSDPAPSGDGADAGPSGVSGATEPGGAGSAENRRSARGGRNLLGFRAGGADLASLPAGGSAPATGGSAAAALSIDDPLQRAAAFSNLILNLTPETLPDVLAAIEQADRRPEDDLMIRNFMLAWVRMDPGAAMNYAVNKDGQRKFYVRNSDDVLIREWARTDAASAIAFIDGLEEKGQNNKSLHHNIVVGMIENDLDAAAAYARTNERSEERGASISRLARAYFERGGQAAVSAWLDAIPGDEDSEETVSYKQYAFAQATREIGRKDPEAAKAWVAEAAEDGYIEERALYYAAESVGRENPSEAAGWLMELPESRERSRVMARAIERWADREPNEAGAWLNEQGTSPELDPAVSAFAREIVGDDPVAAMDWSGTITDEKLRNETLVRVARDWVRRDRDGLRDWAAQNQQIPEGVRGYIERLTAERQNRDRR